MSRADEQTRPGWWPRWVPLRCGGCDQPWLPGRISISFHPCTCQDAGRTGAPAGHDVWHCAATLGCHWSAFPPEHVAGAEESERPRVIG